MEKFLPTTVEKQTKLFKNRLYLVLENWRKKRKIALQYQINNTNELKKKYREIQGKLKLHVT